MYLRWDYVNLVINLNSREKKGLQTKILLMQMSSVLFLIVHTNWYQRHLSGSYIFYYDDSCVVTTSFYEDSRRLKGIMFVNLLVPFVLQSLFCYLLICLYCLFFAAIAKAWATVLIVTTMESWIVWTCMRECNLLQTV